MARTKSTPRLRQFNVRLRAEEWARLERVSEHHGLSHLNTLRLLLKQEADKLLVTPVRAGAKPAKPASY